ncbi:MAG: lamin tail domain-containing protein, partial [Bacteroidales bacterium]|nr:lamin tail domain-containing protein [Bacteroidales bacterium]
MSSNATAVADEDGDYSDWIELHNTSNQALSLAGYGLSDDPEQPFRWVFPAKGIQPGGYLLVWASGKNRINTQQPLHTNFSISAAGEPLLLTHPSGERIDSTVAIT